jgi:choline dehydrogenase-like flavoprotein
LDTEANDVNREADQATAPPLEYDADYIVVGSGAGGATVAARLAEAGFVVLVLEAGGDPRTMVGSSPHAPGINTLPDDYDVPAFHAMATENDAMRWDFYVRHYADRTKQSRDPKYRETVDGKPVEGVLYPRAVALGGCTAHSAMIFVCPNNADWNQIADLTGDSSWRAEKMRGYFERIERCAYRPDERALSRLGRNPSKHGWDGWLQTERPLPIEAILNRDLRTTFFDLVKAVLKSPEFALTDDDRKARLDSELDPNDWRVVANPAIGLRYTPLTTRNHQRVGARERVLDVAQRHPDRLKIQMHALVTRVLFDGSNRAVGVEYQSGPSLYGAHPRPAAAPGGVRRVFAAREVILAGGAFNSPQLLMLSGIGHRADLEKLGIAARVDLPGVGQNLQDRYEVAVVHRMNFASWESVDGATFTSADAQYRKWAAKREGIYTGNGGILSVVARSSPAAPEPDLFLYAVIGRFEGYFPGYSRMVATHPNYLTWLVLKGHTNNSAGQVTLRSADPRTPPHINFRYFEEGNDGRGDDLRAVAEGVAIVRRMTSGLKARGLIAAEELPGESVGDRELPDFVRRHAWGHHASCTCRIGRREDGGVLSTDFRVHGVEGLRVVDASIFPRIPGFFIASAVYMIGEKAADAIADRATERRGPVRPFAR